MTEEVKIPIFVRKATGLTRDVSSFGAYMIPWASMAGSGITVFAIQSIHLYPQANIAVGFLIAGLPALFNALCIVILSIAMPRSGGGYVWGTRIVSPFIGWFSPGWMYFVTSLLGLGLLIWVSPGTIGTILAVVGTTLKNDALVSFATTLSTQTWARMTFAILYNAFLFAIGVLGTRKVLYATYIAWAVNVVGSLTSIGLYYTHNPASAQVSWDEVWGAGAWQQVVDMSEKYGYAAHVASTTKGPMTDTVMSTIDLFWAYTGWETLGYVAGEVRSPRSSFLYWYTAGNLSTIAFYTICGFGPHFAYGDFVGRYVFLWKTYQAGNIAPADAAAMKTPIMFACQPLFSTGLTSNNVVQALASLWFYPATCIFLTYFSTPRTIMSMAFDRMLPERLADVNERWHTPHNACLLLLVLGWVEAFLVAFGFDIFVSAANLSFFTAFYCIVFSWAALVLPYERPEIWELGLKKKILGVPESVILGIISSVFLFEYWFLGCLGMDLTSILVTLAWMLLGLIIYCYYLQKNQSRGVPIKETFREIPPL
jgi:amino acid transporter